MEIAKLRPGILTYKLIGRDKNTQEKSLEDQEVKFCYLDILKRGMGIDRRGKGRQQTVRVY